MKSRPVSAADRQRDTATHRDTERKREREREQTHRQMGNGYRHFRTGVSNDESVCVRARVCV